MSSRAALLTYHDDGSAPSARATPSWEVAAGRTASRLAGVLPAVLVTNAPSVDPAPFARVVHLDVVKEANLTLPSHRALCGVKVFALLLCWERELLPAHVLLLDLDAYVMRPQQLLALFSPLSHYDMVGVMEGYSRGWDGTHTSRRDDSIAAPDPAGRGWEVNTGVLAVRRQAAWLVRKWADEFARRTSLYARLTGADQSALMYVLAREPLGRLFPMPAAFNFRVPSLYAEELGKPIVMHSRQMVRAEVSLNRAIATVADAAHATILKSDKPPQLHILPDSPTAGGGGGPRGADGGSGARPSASDATPSPARNCRRLPGGCGGRAASAVRARGGRAGAGARGGRGGSGGGGGSSGGAGRGRGGGGGGRGGSGGSSGGRGGGATLDCRKLPGGCGGLAAARFSRDAYGEEVAAEANATVRNGPTDGATRALKELSGAWCLARAGCMASWWRPSDVPASRRRNLTTNATGYDPRRGCFLAGSVLPERRGTAPRCSCFAPSEAVGRRVAPCPSPGAAERLAPSFTGEFGFELLHALPFLHWLDRCGLLRATRACAGMRPFYFFSRHHVETPCRHRPARSHWRQGTLPAGVADGWSWHGRQSARFYAYPSERWAPPPLHARHGGLPLPPLDGALTTRRVYMANKFYPEGSGRVENFFSLQDVRLILDTLLACGTQVLYNHPAAVDIEAAPDANDRGRRDGQLGDVEMMRGQYAAHLASGALRLLPALNRSAASGATARARPLTFNEMQLRAVARAACFVVPQGGAGLMTFYQPGLHVVHDVTGKERCEPGSGEYWQYFAQLPQRAGESIVLNTNGRTERLADALRAMCETNVCERAPTEAAVSPGG